nr:hypothetical protein [Ornithinimicrobium cryptoxanthini]
MPLLTAVTPRYEAQLATRLDSSRAVHVVRRCADLAELLGSAAAGIGRVAVVSADLRGLDRAAIQQLKDHDVLVLGVHRPGDEGGERMLRRWGVQVVLSADAEQPQLEGALTELVSSPQHDDGQGGSAPGTSSGGPGSAFRDRPAHPAPDRADPADGTGQGQRDEAADETDRHEGEGPSSLDALETGRGTVVVVWGPVGSPGRTTLAVNVAAELAEPDQPVILADLDTYGASVAQVLAVLDEAPGVAAASRAADQGSLDRATLSRLAIQVVPGLRVLTGMPRPDRWPELRDHAVQDVLSACADLVPVTVVDVGFCLESDEELSFDTTAPRRNGAALAALEVADHVLVVGAADPVGLQRLVRGLDQLAGVTAAATTVVVNRVRAEAIGKNPARLVREALVRFAGVEDVILVAEDQAGVDAAVLAGRTLREARPSSPARVGVREAASRVTGRELAAPRRRVLARRAAAV